MAERHQAVKTVVMIPTFNEKDNILPLIDRINSLGIENLEILVVDDNSPDGTWRLVEQKMANTPNLRLLNRKGPRGRGHAGREGLIKALGTGADLVVEMDGDFSHDPAHIPALLEAAGCSDVVLGSRFVPGGNLMRQSAARNIITKLAGGYLRRLMGLKLEDPTSGYRCFRREALEKIAPETLKAGCAFIMTEVLYRCARSGLKISEIPISFADRAGGESKLGSGKLYARYLLNALWLRLGVY